MPKRYSPEFRRKVLDLVNEGRPIAEVASDLGVTASSIYVWRRQEQIDAGQRPGLSNTDNVELRAARRRIAELETELAVTKRANELLKEAVPPKGVIRPSR
jgi:transposase-like protein